jgi:hypothetical protein
MITVHVIRSPQIIIPLSAALFSYDIGAGSSPDYFGFPHAIPRSTRLSSGAVISGPF